MSKKNDNTLHNKIMQVFLKTALGVHLQYDKGALYKYAEIPAIKKILVQLTDMDMKDAATVIQLVRNYVYSSCEKDSKKIDYPDTPAEIGKILTAIFQHYDGSVKTPIALPPVAMVCAMAAILHSFGIKSRPVSVYSITRDSTLQNHVLCEVFNQESCRWELHDPNFDVAYAVQTENSKPISSLDFFYAVNDHICHIHDDLLSKKSLLNITNFQNIVCID